MTLKKYAIVYFIILLLNLAVVNVVIAQKSSSNTLSPTPTNSNSNITTTTLPSSTSSGESSPSESGSSESSPSSPEDCLELDACKNANETLGLCNGIIKPPSKYIEEGFRHGIYEPDDKSLSKCMCNQPYYDNLTECISCFSKTTATDFKAAPLDKYKQDCKAFGTAFTDTLPPIPPQGASGVPKSVKLGIALGIVGIVVGLVGIGLLKYYRKKRRIAEQTAFASKYSEEIRHSGSHLSARDSLTKSYPPPASPYPPPTSTGTGYAPPPTDYPPPSNMGTMNIPSPQQSTPYYPPPGGEYPPPRSPRGGQGGDQGGQADSYFDSHSRF